MTPIRIDILLPCTVPHGYWRAFTILLPTFTSSMLPTTANGMWPCNQSHSHCPLSNNDIHTYTQPFYGSLDSVRDNPVSRKQKKHSSTHIYHSHQSSLIRFLHLIRSTVSSLFNLLYMPDSLSAESLSKFSFVSLLPWHPPLHTPYISSSNHGLLFASHAHTITTYFTVLLRLCDLFLVSVSALYLELF